MDRIWAYSGPPQDLDGVRFVAVAVAQVDAAQNHVGVLHRTEAGMVEMLHLAWHKELRNQSPRPRLVVTQPDLARSRARSVAAMCRLVWGRHREAGLPYGLRYRSGRFDPITAELLLDDDAAGLTCATFVLALYASCGVRLIDCATWPAREDDAEWHENIIEMLRLHGVESEHIAAVAEETGCARFRPEEVAGACLSDELPGATEQIRAAGLEVVERLRGLPGPP